MVGIPGFSKRLFEALSDRKINVILITQGSSEHSICVGIDDHNALVAKEAVDYAFSHEISSGKVDPLIIGKRPFHHRPGRGPYEKPPRRQRKMFGTLGRNGVNVRAIAQGSSERNISAVIAAPDVKKAINILHEEFFTTTYKQLNLFVTGAGNVGRRLIEQLRQQQDYLRDQLRLQVRVIGLANSRKMLFNNDGIDLDNWKELLEQGVPMNLPEWVRGITSRNLRNSVFADVTANQDVAACYDSLLQKSISVVACNKIACSSPFGYYRKLKDLAREYNSLFLFETM